MLEISGDDITVASVELYESGSLTSPAGRVSSVVAQVRACLGFLQNEVIMGRHKFRQPSTVDEFAECGELSKVVEFQGMDACERCRIITRISLMDGCIDCGHICCTRCVGDCTRCKLAVCSTCWPYHKEHCDELAKTRRIKAKVEQSSLWDNKAYELEHKTGVIQVDI